MAAPDDARRIRGYGQLPHGNTERQPSYTGEQRRLGLLIRCLLTVTGKPFVLQPDDNFDDNAYGHKRTQSNPQALLREERRAVAAMYERTRTGGNVFLNRVAQVRVLSGPPFFPRAKPIEFSDFGL